MFYLHIDPKPPAKQKDLRTIKSGNLLSKQYSLKAIFQHCFFVWRSALHVSCNVGNFLLHFSMQIFFCLLYIFEHMLHKQVPIWCLSRLSRLSYDLHPFFILIKTFSELSCPVDGVESWKRPLPSRQNYFLKG